MALAFLTLNGDEAGHRVRTTTVCRALASVGERPVIFSQGPRALDDHADFPGKHVPSLSDAGERVRRQVAWDIQSVVSVSLPSVLVENTHPNPLRLPSSIRRVLLVPPLAFEALQQLDQRYREVYAAFVLCDAPGSSTWPYSESETGTILACDRWHVVALLSDLAGASRLQHVILGVRPQQATVVTAAAAADTPPDDRRLRRGWNVFPAADAPFVIRVDDVVALDAPLRWLLEMLAARQLHASLDVVPYLAIVSEQSFDAIDASRTLFEVAQHGYAHIPYTVDGKRYEFAPAMQDAPKRISDADAIACGKRRLDTLFPVRFRGGFSAPFNGLPEWLPARWAQLGGAFISCLSSGARYASPLPLVRAGVDAWQWRTNRGLEPRDIVRTMRRQLKDDGHAGLVLHAHRYVRRVERERLSRVLDALDAEGFRSVPLHERAAVARTNKGIGRSLRQTLRMFADRLTS